MKVGIFVLLITLPGFCIGQDIDAKFEVFLHEALQDFPRWIGMNGLDPTAPRNFSDAWFTDENDKISIRANTFDMSYSGLSSHIQPLSIQSNLRNKTFALHLAYGTSSDSCSGTYFLEGSTINSTTPVPIQGRGEFIQTNRTHAPNLPRIESEFEFSVTNEGHLRLQYMATTPLGSGFDILLLNNLDAGEYTIDVVKMMNAGIMPNTGGRSLHSYLWDYLSEVFRATPIEEIIGEPLPPQLNKGRKNLKSGKYLYITEHGTNSGISLTKLNET